MLRRNSPRRAPQLPAADFAGGPVRRTLFDAGGFVRLDISTAVGRAQDQLQKAKDLAALQQREERKKAA